MAIARFPESVLFLSHRDINRNIRVKVKFGSILVRQYIRNVLISDPLVRCCIRFDLIQVC